MSTNEKAENKEALITPEVKALNHIGEALEIAQSKGIFTLTGAKTILDSLNTLDQAINKK